jgi:hypothetical protein
MTSINAHLAAAVRESNAAQRDLPIADRPDLTGSRWSALLRLIATAKRANDPEAARTAIDRWREGNMQLINEAKRVQQP